MIRKVIILTAALLVAACTSVKDTVARLDYEFVKSADKTVLKTTSVKINPARFNQPFLGYQVSNARLSTLPKSDPSLVSSNKTHVTVDSNIIDWLIFDRPYPHDYSYEINNDTYEIETQSRFSFDMGNESTEVIQTRCGSFYLEHSGTSYYAGKQSEDDINSAVSANSIGERVNTFLSCKFSRADTSWYLSMELPMGGKARIDFSETPEDWSITPIQAFDQYLSDGNVISSRELPFWKWEVAGFQIHYRGEQFGAISTIGQPHLWIRKNIPQEQRDQVASLLFSLAVFNDTDKGWATYMRP